jgi:DNA recombination protein RmuC
MEKYIYLIVGLGIGGIIIYLWLKQQYSAENATLKANVKQAEDAQKELQEENEELEKENDTLKENEGSLQTSSAEKDVIISGLEKDLNKLQTNFDELEQEFKDKTNNYNALNSQLATANANNTALEDKLATQKEEMEAMGKKFNTEFENIANKIFETKSEKFTKLNSDSLKNILEPLGKNIKDFKDKVEDVYNKESKERFSLGVEVKKLADKSDKISQDAINLTNALKGEAKTQGNWGEMILESILEKSGLRKDEEYFMEHQLLDDAGKPLRSDSEGKKMRPDAVIKYPDNRNVIIDSKVSLNAFTRYIAATDVTEQKKELDAHIEAIKNHIVSLSAKGYDDYDKALDFVMMFIPSEPAYISAMQGDANLWNYAYDKRILLMNPTNLITSLKLIVDLWKREYQNQNAISIADRGAKLYDKFVGFVENLDKVGKYISSAKTSYDEAYKQLSTGNDNLVLQAMKLEKLGVKNKKELSKALESDASLNKLTE